jgi:GAF domain-containing protein
MNYVRNIPIAAERGSAFGRALLEGRAVHIPDVKADPEYTSGDMQKLGDYRTVLAVPMLREGVATGVLSLTRSDVRPFSERQIELASTFADQAAIAIENVRLFDEVQGRTRKAQAGDGFEPTVAATTRSLGDRVEIRIRDNGTGIPPDVREDVQSLLHHQAGRRRHRARPLDQP